MSTTTGTGFVDLIEKHVETGQMDIPVLPDTALQVIRVTQDEDSSAQDLLRVVQANQGIVGKIMSTANSAAFAPATPITSIQQAITRLGMNIVRDIALASSLNARLFSAPGLEGHVHNACEHALMTALWNRRIAQHLKVDADLGFLCGLLHSVGLPIMLQEVVDVAESTGLEQLDDQLEFIVDIAQELTPQATALAIRSWQLPAAVNRVMAAYLRELDTDSSLLEDTASATSAAPSGRKKKADLSDAEVDVQSRCLAAASELASFSMMDHLDADALLELGTIERLGIDRPGLDQLLAAHSNIRSQFEAFGAF